MTPDEMHRWNRFCFGLFCVAHTPRLPYMLSGRRIGVPTLTSAPVRRRRCSVSIAQYARAAMMLASIAYRLESVAVHMAKKNQVVTTNDVLVKIKADTYCIHSDTPSALQILMYLSHELPMYNLQIKK